MEKEQKVKRKEKGKKKEALGKEKPNRKVSFDIRLFSECGVFFPKKRSEFFFCFQKKRTGRQLKVHEKDYIFYIQQYGRKYGNVGIRLLVVYREKKIKTRKAL